MRTAKIGPDLRLSASIINLASFARLFNRGTQRLSTLSCMNFFLCVSLCMGTFSLALIFVFRFSFFPTPTITFLIVCFRCPFWWSRFHFRRHASRHAINHWVERLEALGTRGSGMTWKSAKISLHSVRERSYKRTINIQNILRRNSSNAFFFRSAALGKSCILHIEYFIDVPGYDI